MDNGVTTYTLTASLNPDGTPAGQSVVNNTQVTGVNSIVGAPGAQGSPGVVQSIVAGVNVAVDDTDPANPVVSSTGGTAGSPLYFDVVDYGAVGDNSTDCTSAIQAAINAAVADNGGTVFFPTGNFVISGGLTLYPAVSLLGVGATASVVRQTSTSATAFSMSSGTVLNASMSIQALGISGPGSGTGNGISIIGVPLVYISMRDIAVASFGATGIYLGGSIVTTMERATSTSNGLHGFWLDGSGSVTTSTSFINCYGNDNQAAGYYLLDCTYCSFTGCASDSNGIGYYVKDSGGISFNGCGTESDVDHGVSGYPGNGFQVDGGGNVGIYNAFVYDMSGDGIAYYFTGSTENNSLIGSREIVPSGPSTISVQTDAGAEVTMIGNTLTSPVNLNGLEPIASDDTLTTFQVPTIFHPVTDATNVFQVISAGSNPVFDVDTSSGDGRVGILTDQPQSSFDVVSESGLILRDNITVSNVMSAFKLIPTGGANYFESAGAAMADASAAALHFTDMNSEHTWFTIGSTGNIAIPNGTLTIGAYTLPDTDGSSNQILETDGSGNVTWATASGGGGTPGGSNTDIQFNNSGAFGGDSGVTYDGSTLTLTSKDLTISGGTAFLSTTNIYGNLTMEAGTDIVLDGSSSGAVTVTAPATPSSYTFTLPPDAGTNTYLLQTDGSGTTSWVAGGGGGGQTTFTKVVAASGGDYTTLSAALAAASDGWLIRVMPGTYTEGGFTNTNNNVTVEGAGWGSTILNFSSNTAEFDGNNVTFIGVQTNFTTGGLYFEGTVAIIDSISYTKSSGTNTGFFMLGDQSILQNSQLTWSFNTTGTVLQFDFSSAGYSVINNIFTTTNVYTTDGAIRFFGSAAHIVGNQFHLTSTHSTPLVYLHTDAQFIGNYLIDDTGSSTASLLQINASQVVVSDNNIPSGHPGTAIGILGSNEWIMITGNYLNAKNGVSIGSATIQGTVMGNIIRGISTSSGGIGVDVNGNNNIVNANNVFGFTTGIHIESGSTKSIATSNISLSNGTNFTDGGTSTTAANNITS